MYGKPQWNAKAKCYYTSPAYWWHLCGVERMIRAVREGHARYVPMRNGHFVMSGSLPK